MLRCLNEMFKVHYEPLPCVMGFTENRSVVTNATVHRGQNYIFNIDLKDFFHSIDQARIRHRLQNTPPFFKPSIAKVLVGICTMKFTTEEGETKYVLPQGSPASPILTNIVCETLDCRLTGLAKRFHLNYTRYADDITFSSMHNVYAEQGEFRQELKNIIEQQNFTINDAKTRLQKRGGRQEVIGIIVSHKLNVRQTYVRDLRNLLYIWDRYGYHVTFQNFCLRFAKEKGHDKFKNPNMLHTLEGKLNYLKMVKGESDSIYQRLLQKFKSLNNGEQANHSTSTPTITYLETLPLLAFEKKHQTEISFQLSPPATNEPPLPTSLQKPFHRYAHFVLSGQRHYVSLKKSLKSEELPLKQALVISCCHNASKNELFWLIHRKSTDFA